MSAVQLLDSTNKVSVQYLPASITTPIHICTPGTITKQTSITSIPESQFTLPYTGYYSYSIELSLNTTGAAAGDIFSCYADLVGGFLTIISGTSNIISVVPNATGTCNVSLSGIINEPLNAGDEIRFLHIDSGAYNYTAGAFTATYCYLGNTLM